MEGNQSFLLTVYLHKLHSILIRLQGIPLQKRFCLFTTDRVCILLNKPNPYFGFYQFHMDGTETHQLGFIRIFPIFFQECGHLSNSVFLWIPDIQAPKVHILSGDCSSIFEFFLRVCSGSTSWCLCQPTSALSHSGILSHGLQCICQKRAISISSIIFQAQE